MISFRLVIFFLILFSFFSCWESIYYLFSDKCTIMNPLFGEGWIAFGHVLTAESEHEQAMNCYLRVCPKFYLDFKMFECF